MRTGLGVSRHGRAGDNAQEEPGFQQRFVECGGTEPLVEQIDQVAIFTPREILPGPGFATVLRLEPDREALPLGTRGIADLPIVALFASFGEILTKPSSMRRGWWVMLVRTNRVSFSSRFVSILDHECVISGRMPPRCGL